MPTRCLPVVALLASVVLAACDGTGSSPAPTATTPTKPEPKVAPVLPSAALVAKAAALKCERRSVGEGERARKLWGCVDETGKGAIPFEYIELSPFSSAGLAAGVRDGGLVFIDAANRVVLQGYSFDNGHDPLQEGRRRFRFGGKVGYLDKDYRIVIPAQYDAAFAFEGGKAKVCVGCDPSIWSKRATRPEEELVGDGEIMFIDLHGERRPEGTHCPPSCPPSRADPT